MSPVNNMATYYNTSIHMGSSSPTSSSSSVSSSSRFDQIQARLELARNFYDDYEFCPVQCSDETFEHRDRIQQRLSPQSSPNSSPSMSSGYISPRQQHQANSPPRRAIPIIDPSNMTPVSVPMKSNSISPILASQYQQQQYWAAVQMNSMRAYNAIPIINPSTGRSSMGFHDVLVQ